MQENRSFDHYFGTYPGVRGFDDRSDGAIGRFMQPWPGGAQGHLLPYRLSDSVASICAGSYSAPDIEWITQHAAWNGGRLDAFLGTEARGATEPSVAPLVMSYLTRSDITYYYALADAFTICDNYYCSVLGPTMPNRMYWVSGTIDPGGNHGGPVVDTPEVSKGAHAWGACDWETMPEVLEAHGISWKVYQQAGTASGPAQKSAPATSFNVLSFFKQHVGDPGSALYRRAFLPSWPGDFDSDVRTGKLPAVSWVLPPLAYSEHPSTDPLAGQWFVSQILAKLMADPAIWSKTVVFLTYDENGGFFDHVVPPTAPAETPGETLTAAPRTGRSGSFNRPIGLGFRVPTIVISPWSTGGWVSSATFDHTSMLRFVEARFGVTAPNITSWRRRTVGDMTSTLSFDNPAASPPPLPDASFSFGRGCPTPGNLASFLGTGEPVTVPADQQMPAQEAGSARRR
jgi:phospholipase C